MPGLNHLLKESDTDLLAAFAQAWGLEDTKSPGIVDRLQAAMQSNESVNEIVSALADSARSAMMDVASKKGRMNWTDFSRLYGEVRVMGAARREKEQPAQNPQSTAEILWYRGLIGKAFFESKPEAREFAYIPDEILAHLVSLKQPIEMLPARPASSKEIAFKMQSGDKILQDACTLLSEFRSARKPGSFENYSVPVPFLQRLLQVSGLVDQSGQTNSERVKVFLEADPAKALQFLFDHWRTTKDLTDLEFVQGLSIESLPGCHPIESRNAILEQLIELPADEWWNLQSFIEYFHKSKPDFQRPAGDFDSWFIRQSTNGEYLGGFESWDLVDGALIRFLISGPLHWFGVADLASPAQSDPVHSFKLSKITNSLLNSEKFTLAAEDARIAIRSNGLIHFPAHSSRAARYIVSRFCKWETSRPGEYIYSISAKSLSTALSQGLKVHHLLRVLQEASQQTVPPNLKSALEKWERLGSQAEIEHTVVLHITKPELLEQIKKTKASRLIKKVIDPTTIEIAAGSEKQIAAELLEIGYLVDFKADV